MSSDPLGGPILFQLILILLNAFFAAAEIAVLSLNDAKLRHQAENGDKTAVTLLKLAENPNRFLSTIQVGITLAGFLGSAFAAENFASRLAQVILDAGAAINPALLNSLCIVLITLVLSYFTLVLGELVPKRIAMQHPEKVSRISCRIILTLAGLFRPIVWLLSKSTNGMLRLLGLNPNAQPEEVTEEEIRAMVDMGEETGGIESDERDMIKNVFEFNDLTAADCMTHRTDVTAIWIQDDDETILRTIKESGLSRFPVYNEDIDDVIGILATRDYLLNARAKQPKPLKALLREPYFVPETVPTDVLLRNMQKEKTHLAIVVDEYGGTSGLITMEDLLEEIVGNIYDEFDPTAKADITPIGNHVWRVRGTTDLETLAEALDVTLPESEDFDTLGGLIFSRFSTIPQDGTTPCLKLYCTRDGEKPEEGDAPQIEIQVETIEDRRVEWAKVTVVPIDEGAKNEEA